METDLRAPHAFLPHACLCLAACDTPEPSSHCTDLQQIPSLNKQGKLHNNKDPFSSAAYFQVIAGKVLTHRLSETFAVCRVMQICLNLCTVLLNRRWNCPWDGFDTDMWNTFEIKKSKSSQQILALLSDLSPPHQPQFLLCPRLQLSAHHPPGPHFILLMFFLFVFFFCFLLPLLSITCLILFSCVERGYKTRMSRMKPAALSQSLRGMHFLSGRSFIRNKPSTRMQEF